MKVLPREELEKFEEEILLLKKEELVIVEGIKDKSALKKFGVKRIITLGQPLYKIVEMCKEEAAVLTDLDAEGRRIHSRIKNELSRRGVKVNDRFRNFLFKYTKLRQVEGLETYINHLRQKCKI